MVLAEAGLRVLVLEAGPDLSPSGLRQVSRSQLRPVSSYTAVRQRLRPSTWLGKATDSRSRTSSRTYTTRSEAFVLGAVARQVGGAQPHLGRDHPAALPTTSSRRLPRWARPLLARSNQDLAPYLRAAWSGCWRECQRDGLCPSFLMGSFLRPLPYTRWSGTWARRW